MLATIIDESNRQVFSLTVMSLLAAVFLLVQSMKRPTQPVAYWEWIPPGTPG